MVGEYLSNIINTDDFQQNKLNLIQAPCGCGKTTFAKTVLKKIQDNYNDSHWDSLYKRDMLYLIDTVMGKEQLLNSKESIEMENNWTCEPYWKIPGITVMTYAGYQTLCEKAPHYNDWNENSVIVCDELDQEILFSKWNEDNNLHEKAVGKIAYNIAMTNNLVVALSATPQLIKKEFEWCLNEIPLTGTPRHFEDKHIEEYSNLKLLLNKIKKGQRGILYLSKIDEMKKYETYLQGKGFNCIAVWSKNRKDKQLSEKQKQVREYIVSKKELPPDVDILIINRACATSITIGEREKTVKPIDFMIIHSSQKELQQQVRGRYRNDLADLYLHQSGNRDVIELSSQWLFRKLSKNDRDKLCEELGFKDENGRLLKWPSIKARLIKSGYIISNTRTSAERFVTIEEL